jgi:phenylacetate-CoA ligase
VKEFIIRQVKIDTFEIEYVSTLELSQSQIEKTEEAITIYLEPSLKLTFIRKTILQRNNRGKLKQFTAMV